MKGNKENSFNVPEGDYRIRLVDAKIEFDRQGKERLRLVGDAISMKDRFTNFQIGKNYPEGSTEMLQDLHTILGGDVVEVVNEDGAVLPEGLHLLRDKECDVRIVHVPSRKHEHPYCRVVLITRPGVLVRMPDDDAT